MADQSLSASSVSTAPVTSARARPTRAPRRASRRPPPCSRRRAAARAAPRAPPGPEGASMRSPRPHASAYGAVEVRNGTSAPSRDAIASSALSPIGRRRDARRAREARRRHPRYRHRALRRRGCASRASIANPAGQPVAPRILECGAPREVALDGTELPRVDLAGHVERSRAVGGAHDHVVGEREPEEQRLELMVARRFAGEDAEAEVDLRLRGDACRAGARLRARAHDSDATGADCALAVAVDVRRRSAALRRALRWRVRRARSTTRR